jgi:hypothetical protein
MDGSDWFRLVRLTEKLTTTVNTILYRKGSDVYTNMLIVKAVVDVD